MSNLVPIQKEITAAQGKFLEIVTKAETGVVFAVESMFAEQAMQRNEYLAGIALNNLQSLRNSIINVASIGLSLNPVTAYAYLVPRDGMVCLDVSYKGLIKLATDSGSILWAKADLVYESDTFKYLGPSKVPLHEADIFSKERGPFVGCYCVAKTCDGDHLVEVMTAEEVEQVKSSSKTQKADTPWRKWFGEMTKKTVIKRASKTWPRSDKNERLYKAIDVINQHEGMDIDVDISGPEYISEEQVVGIENEITVREIDKPKFLAYAKVENISEIEAKDYQTIMAAIKAKPVKK